MPPMNAILFHIDGFLIYFYRIFDTPIVGYLFGTFVLALLCALLGQLTIAAAFFINKGFIDRDNAEMVRMQNLSVYALVAKNKGAYKACNKEANEAFGKVFFMQIALAASSLWPVPFALEWMQARFREVDFALPFSVPGIGDSVGYSFTFFPIFILVVILFGKIKHRLPVFGGISRKLATYDEAPEQMISLADLHPDPGVEGCR